MHEIIIVIESRNNQADFGTSAPKISMDSVKFPTKAKITHIDE